AERPIGLRDSVALGSTLTMKAGSAAQLQLASEEPDRLHPRQLGAGFAATQLPAERRRGGAQSIGERATGVGSVAAAGGGRHGRVVAALSVSGPIERITRQPGRLHAASVMSSANHLTEMLRGAGS